MAHSNCGLTCWLVLVLPHHRIFKQALFLFALQSCIELMHVLFFISLIASLMVAKDMRSLSCDTPTDTSFERDVKTEKSVDMAVADDRGVIFIPNKGLDHAKESLQKNKLGYQHLHSIPPQFLITSNRSWFSFPVTTYSAPISRKSVIGSRADASITCAWSLAMQTCVCAWSCGFAR